MTTASTESPQRADPTAGGSATDGHTTAREIEPVPWPFDRTQPALDRPTFRILVVCTANAARSPLIEFLLQEELDRLAPGAFAVSSAGTRARAGSSMAAGTRALLHRFGLEPRSFAGTPLSPELLTNVDLVIGAERSHVAVVLAERPALLKRTFTFVELARIADRLADADRLTDVDPRADAPTSEGAPTPDPDPRMFVARASTRRVPVGHAESAQLDLADPVGDSPVVFEVLGQAMGAGIASIARGLTGGGDSR